MSSEISEIVCRLRCENTSRENNIKASLSQLNDFRYTQSNKVINLIFFEKNISKDIVEIND